MSEWREIAEWDWVLVGDGELLHAVASLDNEATVDDQWFGVGRTECGRRSENMTIPGLFTRMSESTKRCPRCCKAVGMPEGAQSPKNVEECRPIAEVRIAALGREPERVEDGEGRTHG